MYRRAFVNTNQIRQVIKNCKKSSNEDLTKINPPTKSNQHTVKIFAKPVVD